MGDQGPDYSSLPLLDRFVHKVWKVRKEAYEEAARLFEKAPDESDPVYKPFLQDPGLWKGAVADSNVAAQQEGIAALCMLLKFAGTPACTRTRTQAIPPLVEKGLSSTRAATKVNSIEALLLYIELDTPGPVIEELIPHLSHKQPKIIAATLSALTTIYHAYGCKTADPKPVLKALPKVFGHADKNVRTEAQNLAVELYRWLKEAMKSVFWNDLKPVQQQDLEALFEKLKQDPSPKQERLLRSQQEAGLDSAGGGNGDPGGEEIDEEPEEVDAFDLAEPVDITSKIPSDLYENLASTKWKDRKDSLDALYAVLNVPRIKDADFGELVRALAKCMKDANVTVVTVAASCVEALANGTRTGFGKYRSSIMSPMMERLKEKKQAVADALGAAMDAVFTSTSLSDCLEDTLEFMKHKNPQVKLESVRFLIRCLRNTKEVPTKAEVKLISDAATKLLTESTEVLRSSGAEILGTVMKIMGERAMNPYLDGLDEIRRSKIKEFYEKAEVKAKDKPKPVAPPPAAAPPKGTKPAAGKKAMEKKSSAGGTKSTSNPGPATEETKPAGRGIPSKLGGPAKPTTAGQSGGLKLQKRPGGPGTAASAAASPVKHGSSHTAPTAVAEEEPTSAPKLGLGGRGLTGRSLGRPTPATQPVELPAPAGSALKAQERAELEELRAENERLRHSNEELKSERAKLMSEIHELQNQNAQLIEDNTRNVLGMKAKETQLVRARSDAEAAEQTCQRQQRELERLKRELNRLSPASPGSADLSEHIYRDTGFNGVAPTAYGLNHGRPMITKRSTYAFEEKENGGPLDAVDLRGVMKMASPTLSSAVSSGTGGGRNSPTISAGGGGGGGGGGGAAAGSTTNNGEGIESWKRAAEVTSQLKARIEQMKARQGITKP